MKYLLFILVILFSVISYSQDDVEIKFPYLSSDSIMDGDLFYFSIKSEKQSVKIKIFQEIDDPEFNSPGKTIEIIPLIYIANNNKSQYEGIVWSRWIPRYLLNKNISEAKVTLIIKINSTDNISIKDRRIQLKIRRNENLNENAIEHLGKIFESLNNTQCLSEIYSIPAEVRNNINISFNGDSEIIKMCNVIDASNKLINKCETQNRIVFSMVIKEKGNYFKSNNDFWKEFYNFLSKTQINLEPERNALLKELQYRASSYAYYRFYPYYVYSIVQPLSITEAESIFSKYYTNDMPFLFRDEIYQYVLFIKNKGAADNLSEIAAKYKEFVVSEIVNDSKLPIKDKCSLIESCVLANREKASPKNISGLIKNIIYLSVKEKDTSIALSLCGSFMTDADSNKTIIDNYEKGIVYYYENDEAQLKSQLEIEGKRKLVSSFNNTRIIPLNIIFSTIKKNGNSGRILYEYFTKVISDKSEDNIVNVLKNNDKDTYDGFMEVLNGRYGNADKKIN